MEIFGLPVIPILVILAFCLCVHGILSKKWMKHLSLPGIVWSALWIMYFILGILVSIDLIEL